MKDTYTYFITDIEADGPIHGVHSMISLASAAYDEAGTELSTFEMNLKPIPGGVQYPETMEFWAKFPEAWEHSTSNPKDPKEVMEAFAAWVESYPGQKTMVAHPIAFDFAYVNWYLLKYLGRRVFNNRGIDIPSYLMATLGSGLKEANRRNWPDDWFGGNEHNHQAMDDVRGYAKAFFEIKKLNAKLDKSAVLPVPDYKLAI